MSKSGHRYVATNPKPYLKAGLKVPTTCAYCGKPAGDASHNRG